MDGSQTVATKDIQGFLDTCRELFKGHVDGLARFGDDRVLRVKFKRSYVEFSGGGEVFFFNTGRTTQGGGTKQVRSTNYFYVSDGNKQLTVRMKGDGKATLALATYDSQVRRTG